jgi:hypothetical protein
MYAPKRHAKNLEAGSRDDLWTLDLEYPRLWTGHIFIVIEAAYFAKYRPETLVPA